MKALKHFICLVFCLFAFMASGQETKTPEERATIMTAWMKENLKLSAVQEKPISDLNFKYAKLNEELKAGSASRMQKFKALKSNNDAKETELKKILTAEQYDIYKNKKEELEEKLKEKAKERRKS